VSIVSRCYQAKYTQCLVEKNDAGVGLMKERERDERERDERERDERERDEREREREPGCKECCRCRFDEAHFATAILSSRTSVDASAAASAASDAALLCHFSIRA
jgi:hypothetical protein